MKRQPTDVGWLLLIVVMLVAVIDAVVMQRMADLHIPWSTGLAVLMAFGNVLAMFLAFYVGANQLNPIETEDDASGDNQDDSAQS